MRLISSGIFLLKLRNPAFTFTQNRHPGPCRARDGAPFGSPMTIAASPNRIRLWIEFSALFVGVPLIMLATFGLYPLFPVIIGLAGVSCLLLQITPGWKWKMLWRGPVLGEWKIILIYALVTCATCVVIVQTTIPERFLTMPYYNPGLWIMIMTLYPLVSAFPQEIIFRSLFFERYGVLFSKAWIAIAANGAVFGFGHLFYENWITITMTGIGGAIMGWAYMRNRSVLLAWVLHSLAGQILFTVGLGVYFYHGAVGSTP